MNCLMSVYFYIVKGMSLESVPTLGITGLGNICTSSLTDYAKPTSENHGRLNSPWCIEKYPHPKQTDHVS